MASIYDANGVYAGEDNTGPGVRSAGGLDVNVPTPAKAAAKSTSTSSAPPTAVDAPTKGQNNIFTGLCEALNQHQQDLVKKYPGYVADEYAIDFAAQSIGSAKVTKPGPITYRNTAGKNVNTAQDKVDPITDSVSTNSQTWNILAGTQIVQLIDQIMRSSTYITDQQKVNIDENGKQTKNAKANTNGVTAWYKINVTAKQLKYDKVRRDFAYRMTFTISPYSINQMVSPFFPQATYRGSHKAYNYWFTGQNTQILNYEQEYNQAYYTTLSSNASGLAISPPTGRDQTKQTYMATSEQRTQGQANYVNEPADNAASFLYSVSDFGEVRLKIVGDPAWMQQGEVAFGVNARSFEYRPFNADGGINYDSQEVTFTVSFSRPTDYNFNTGIMNTNNGSGAPQETFAYIAKSCKNVFSKGQFTQELVGSLLPLANSTNPSKADNGRAGSALGAAKSLLNGADVRTTGIPQSQADAQDSENGANSGTGTGSTDTESASTVNDTEGNGLASPQPASAPGDPTSSGDIDPFAGLAGTSPGAGGFTPPATAAVAVANANGGVEALTPEARQIQALGASLNKPQEIAKDDS